MDAKTPSIFSVYLVSLLIIPASAVRGETSATPPAVIVLSESQTVKSLTQEDVATTESRLTTTDFISTREPTTRLRPLTAISTQENKFAFSLSPQVAETSVDSSISHEGKTTQSDFSNTAASAEANEAYSSAPHADTATTAKVVEVTSGELMPASASVAAEPASSFLTEDKESTSAVKPFTSGDIEAATSSSPSEDNTTASFHTQPLAELLSSSDSDVSTMQPDASTFVVLAVSGSISSTDRKALVTQMAGSSPEPIAAVSSSSPEDEIFTARQRSSDATEPGAPVTSRTSELGTAGASPTQREEAFATQPVPSSALQEAVVTSSGLSVDETYATDRSVTAKDEESTAQAAEASASSASKEELSTVQQDTSTHVEVLADVTSASIEDESLTTLRFSPLSAESSTAPASPPVDESSEQTTVESTPLLAAPSIERIREGDERVDETTAVPAPASSEPAKGYQSSESNVTEQQHEQSSGIDSVSSSEDSSSAEEESPVLTSQVPRPSATVELLTKLSTSAAESFLQLQTSSGQAEGSATDIDDWWKRFMELSNQGDI